MVQLIRGIKAGIVAGLIYGVLYAFGIWAFFYVFTILLKIPTEPPISGGRYVQLRVNPFAGLLIGPIYGVILGIIYAFAYNRLPGASQMKGAVLAFIAWIIIFLISLLTGAPGLLFSELAEYRLLQILLTGFALWFFIILGLQLGSFWDRFKPKEPKLPPPPPPSPQTT